MNLLWLKNINKEGIAILGIKYDRSVWKKTLVVRIQEDGRKQWRNGFGINEREQQYVHMKSQPKNEKYANGSVGASVRIRLMVRGGCLPVRGSKGMEWKYDDDLCVCGTKETVYPPNVTISCLAMLGNHQSLSGNHQSLSGNHQSLSGNQIAILGCPVGNHLPIKFGKPWRLMVRGGCLPVRGSKGMEWKYDDDLCVCGTKETEIHMLF